MPIRFISIAEQKFAIANSVISVKRSPFGLTELR